MARFLPIVLILLYLLDVWRVDDKFMFLVDAPEKGRSEQTELMKFLSGTTNQYRVLPMDGSDPMHYVSNKIPVMFTPNAVQQQRWQEYLDNFSVNSAMTDILNVKYLVFDAEQYAGDKAKLDTKFQKVYSSPDGRQVVVENTAVLPKAWLVPSVYKVDSPEQIPPMLQSPLFKPHEIALVESAAPLNMEQPFSGNPGAVKVDRYEGERIQLTATVTVNSLLVLGDKYYRGWKATVDGTPTVIYPVNYILRGVYLPPGNHRIEFVFDPAPFKVGKWLTLSSFALFAALLLREWTKRRRRTRGARESDGPSDIA